MNVGVCNNYFFYNKSLFLKKKNNKGFLSVACNYFLPM